MAVAEIDRERQYERLRAVLARSPLPKFRDRPLRDWAEPDESHLPSVLVDRRVIDLVQFSLPDHRARRGVGERGIEKFLTLLERVAREAGADTSVEPLAPGAETSLIEPSAEYSRLRLELLSLRSEEALRELDRPLRRWHGLDLDGLPFLFSRAPLASLLMESWDDHCGKRSIGKLRAKRFVEVLREVRRRLVGASPSAEVTFAEWVDEFVDPGEPRGDVAEAAELNWPPALPANPTELDETAWQRIHVLLDRHHLARQPLGRFAVTLADVPRSRWRDPLGDYTGKPLAKTRDLPGMGPTRFGKIAAVILRIARPLEKVGDGDDEREGLSVQILPERIARVRSWVDEVLAGDRRPNADEITDEFLEPLLEQIGWDLGFETAECLRGRLGLNGEVLTLQTLADKFDLSRERIRQLTARASDVLSVRWPEARHLLDDFYEHFRPHADAAAAAALVGRTMDLLFNVEVSGDESPEEVLEKWRKVGRARCTPFTTDEVLSWAAGTCPGVKPDVARGWIDATCPVLDSVTLYADEGETLHFTEEPLDGLLVQLVRGGEPLHLRDAADLTGYEERSLKSRLDRDLRFLRDEFGRVVPSGRYRLRRRGDVWKITLPSADGSEREMSVEALRTLIVSGLSAREVHDATVWGVHRFAQESLGRLFGVTLPPGLDQFLLADVLVQESNGDVRSMRRRRLRWDDAGGTATAHGKRGWACRAVSDAGTPLTLSELGERMRWSYQDYEPYVIGQMPTAFEGRDDEEGENPHAIRFEGGGPLPTVAVPEGWEFDPTRMNVSPDVRRAALRAASKPPHELNGTPDWFRALLQEVRLGHVEEPSDRTASADRSEGSTSPDNPPAAAPPSAPSAPAPIPEANLDEALAGLF